jgi:hypothetical protein
LHISAFNTLINEIFACLKVELHEQQNCCNLQQNLISRHVNWKRLHINYKSQGNMCRHFYLTCVEIRFCCKLQQFCCSCNSSFTVPWKLYVILGTTPKQDLTFETGVLFCMCSYSIFRHMQNTTGKCVDLTRFSPHIIYYRGIKTTTDHFHNTDGFTYSFCAC